MTSPPIEPEKQPHPDPDREHELDVELVTDLDVNEEHSDKVRGGISRTPGCVMNDK